MSKVLGRGGNLLVLLMTGGLLFGCAGDANDSVNGAWLSSDGSTVIEFNDDETFTFAAGPITSAGTYVADSGELTFTFTENSNAGCQGKTITWDYQVDGDSLTAEVIGDECTNAVGTNWTLTRTGS